MAKKCVKKLEACAKLLFYCFFAVLVAVAIIVAKAPFYCDPKILLPWLLDISILLSIATESPKLPFNLHLNN